MPTQDTLAPFLPLGDYVWPTLPADDRLRIIYERLKNEILRSDKSNGPIVADDLLTKATAEVLDKIAAPPACGQLLDELDATLLPWIASPHPDDRLQLIILPPCDENEIVSTWAAQKGLPCLAPPIRTDLRPVTEVSLPDIEGDGILVIPRLEDWFIRHQDGLNVLRSLLAALSASNRRCVIGCNSWAWAYLSAAIDAQMQLPDGITFQAFDGGRLSDWFSKLASNPASGISKFRMTESGTEVFSRCDDGTPKSDFFQKLAAHSLGIPWVAWTLWRRSLRTSREDAGVDDIEDDDETLWIAALDDFALPQEHRQAALLVLQSLLIHGPLSAQNLRLTVPIVGRSNVIPALISAGFLRVEDDLLCCVAAAYPAMRRELSNAGFSMDRL